MTTQVITLSPKLFIDLEGAFIPVITEVPSQSEPVAIRRSSLSFSEMKTGKFRKIFNRHSIAYKH